MTSSWSPLLTAFRTVAIGCSEDLRDLGQKNTVPETVVHWGTWNLSGLIWKKTKAQGNALACPWSEENKYMRIYVKEQHKYMETGDKYTETGERERGWLGAWGQPSKGNTVMGLLQIIWLRWQSQSCLYTIRSLQRTVRSVTGKILYLWLQLKDQNSGME